MRHNLLTVTGGLLALFIANNMVKAGTFTETFDGPSISPSLGFTRQDSGFSSSLSSGKIQFTKDPGTTTGFEILKYTPLVTGDFTVTVDVGRSDPHSGMSEGLYLIDGTNPNQFIGDIYLTGTSQIWSVSFFPNSGNSFVNDSSLTGSLEIQRIGQTVNYLYNTGGSYTLLRSQSDPALTGPVQFGMFLGEETGVSSASLATFDNLTITSASVPEPSSLALLSVAGLWVIRRARRRVSA